MWTCVRQWYASACYVPSNRSAWKPSGYRATRFFANLSPALHFATYGPFKPALHGEENGSGFKPLNVPVTPWTEIYGDTVLNWGTFCKQRKCVAKLQNQANMSRFIGAVNVYLIRSLEDMPVQPSFTCFEFKQFSHYSPMTCSMYILLWQRPVWSQPIWWAWLGWYGLDGLNHSGRLMGYLIVKLPLFSII